MGREPLETSEERHAEQSSYLPSHLIPMGHESWALWRLLAVRGTGFPIAELLKLSTPACALAADRLIAEEMPGNGDQHNESAALHNFRRTFHQALLQTSRVVYETAQMLPFREAVIWQNRQAFHNMIERLTPPPKDAVDLRYRNSQQRRREEMVALYLQRYCAKNETIGFLAPAVGEHSRPRERQLPFFRRPISWLNVRCILKNGVSASWLGNYRRPERCAPGLRLSVIPSCMLVRPTCASLELAP